MPDTVCPSTAAPTLGVGNSMTRILDGDTITAYKALEDESLFRAITTIQDLYDAILPKPPVNWIKLGASYYRLLGELKLVE